MPSDVLRGMASGAAGTTALNLVTYVDMALRGRPASEVPEKVAGKLAETLGLEALMESGAAASSSDPQERKQAQEKAGNRRSSVGALLGYGAGLGIGLGYGLLRPRLRGFAVPVAGVAIGLAAMAASDTPSIVTGATDPRSWGVSGWLSDLIPHLVYGLVTASVYELLGSSRASGRYGVLVHGR